MLFHEEIGSWRATHHETCVVQNRSTRNVYSHARTLANLLQSGWQAFV